MAARLLSDGGDDGDAIVAEINVTPLTDIFLVLLIIFMVTSSAMMQQGSKVSLPSSEKGSAEAVGITLTATASHTLELNGVTVERAGLREALAKALGAGIGRANLADADLSAAIFLTQSQLALALGNAGTTLSAPLRHPAHWNQTPASVSPLP